MIEVSFQLFRELEADFSGPEMDTGRYRFHVMYPDMIPQWPHRYKLRYFILKKAVEAARHIRVMAMQQRILIFVGQHNEQSV